MYLHSQWLRQRRFSRHSIFHLRRGQLRGTAVSLREQGSTGRARRRQLSQISRVPAKIITADMPGSCERRVSTKSSLVNAAKGTAENFARPAADHSSDLMSLWANAAAASSW